MNNVVTAANLIEVELSAQARTALLEGARERVVIEWFGCVIEIRCNQFEEAELLRRRYSAFAVGGSPAFVCCAAACPGREPVFFSNPGTAYRYPRVLDQPTVVAFLADAVVQRAFFGVHPKITSFHAAALRMRNSALAISAVSTGGKSTTAFACARRGMGLYSDERCVVIDGCVHPFPRAVNLRANGIELLVSEDVPGDTCISTALRAHAGADWESAQFSELLGEHALPEPARLDAIFFIAGRARVPSVVQMDLEPALRTILDAALCGPLPGMDRLVAATRLVRQTPAFALTLGSPDDTALLVAATVAKTLPILAVAAR